MNQTSIERLKDYLVQLPPQSQALLMREFERAIERGELPRSTDSQLVLETLVAPLHMRTLLTAQPIEPDLP